MNTHAPAEPSKHRTKKIDRPNIAEVRQADLSKQKKKQIQGARVPDSSRNDQTNQTGFARGTLHSTLPTRAESAHYTQYLTSQRNASTNICPCAISPSEDCVASRGTFGDGLRHLANAEPALCPQRQRTCRDSCKRSRQEPSDPRCGTR